jgi:hypothetical protein
MGAGGRKFCLFPFVVAVFFLVRVGGTSREAEPGLLCRFVLQLSWRSPCKRAAENSCSKYGAERLFSLLQNRQRKQKRTLLGQMCARAPKNILVYSSCTRLTQFVRRNELESKNLPLCCVSRARFPRRIGKVLHFFRRQRRGGGAGEVNVMSRKKEVCNKMFKQCSQSKLNKNNSFSVNERRLFFLLIGGIFRHILPALG